MTGLDAYRGKLALVTGAGDGIGEMLARNLAEAGMRVCVQDIREDAAAGVASEIGEAAFPLAFDVSDREACIAAAEELAKRGERLNLLWLNAGVGVGSPVISGKASAVEWAFSVNVLGIVWSAQAFRPLMDAAEGPRHVGFTASSAALVTPDGDFPLYAATKHATMAVAEAMAGELAKDGIAATILMPGLFNTKIWDGAKARPERFGGPRHMDPAIAERWETARKPDAMWPAIKAKIAAGGGYLTCLPEPETVEAFEARVAALRDSIILL